MTGGRPLLLAAALLLAAPGCVIVARSRQGAPIDREAVAALEVGETTLPQVLDLLGAPLEVHQHADGQLLVYRRTGRNTFRFGVSAGYATRFVDVTQVTSELLGNLSVTLERIHADEDRVVVLLDRSGVVQAVGTRFAVDDLAVF